MTDNLISMDDKYLYMTLYLHGNVRQYDITDRSNPRYWLGVLSSEAPITKIPQFDWWMTLAFYEDVRSF